MSIVRRECESKELNRLKKECRAAKPLDSLYLVSRKVKTFAVKPMTGNFHRKKIIKEQVYLIEELGSQYLGIW